MNLTEEALVFNTAVRMVIPMRREFNNALDVSKFMREAAYAKEVLNVALTSSTPRLRECAEFLERHFSGASKPTKSHDQETPRAARLLESAAFKMRRAEAVKRLLQLVGPMGEPLCIKMERTNEDDALDALLQNAQQLVANIRGTNFADGYLAGVNAVSDVSN
ncbi:MAG: hypothetical protein RIS44_1173 [Pseudomonadota bacterium]|jgi:hypothetical protein